MRGPRPSERWTTRMHPNPHPSSAWLILVLVGWLGLVVAQVSVTLVFDPGAGRSVQMSVQSQGEMILVGIPGTPDRTVVETFSLGGVTSTVTTRVRVRP